MSDTRLTRGELAERWHTTSAALAQLAYLGKGPAYFRVGKQALYRLSDVLAYEESTLIHPGAA